MTNLSRGHSNLDVSGGRKGKWKGSSKEAGDPRFTARPRSAGDGGEQQAVERTTDRTVKKQSAER